MSKFVRCIIEAQVRGYLPECFTPEEVRRAFEELPDCEFHDNTFYTFLSKHRRGNPGGYREYFEECEEGGYRLIEDIEE